MTSGFISSYKCTNKRSLAIPYVIGNYHFLLFTDLEKGEPTFVNGPSNDQNSRHDHICSHKFIVSDLTFVCAKGHLCIKTNTVNMKR